MDRAKRSVVWDQVCAYQQARKTRPFLLLVDDAVNQKKYITREDMVELHRLCANCFEFYETYLHDAYQYMVPLSPVNINDPAQYMNQLVTLRRFTWNRVKKTMEKIGRTHDDSFRKFGYARFASLAQRIMLGNSIFGKAPPTVLTTDPHSKHDLVIKYYTRYPGAADDDRVRTVRALNTTLWLCNVADEVCEGHYNPNAGTGIGPEQKMITLLAGDPQQVPDRENVRDLTRSHSRSVSPAFREQPPALRKKSLFTADGSPVTERSPARAVPIRAAPPPPPPPTPPPKTGTVVAKKGAGQTAGSGTFGVAAVGIVLLGIVLMTKGRGNRI